MKLNLYHIILLLSCVAVQAQSELNLSTIDSIRNRLVRNETKDSVFIAKEYYKIGELYRKSLLCDTAYYYFHISEKIFRKYNYRLETAQTLYGIAACQNHNKDYVGAETTIIESLTLLNELEDIDEVNMYKAYNYNVLGIVFDELDLYDESIRYFEEALKLKEDLKGDFTRSIGLTLNNLIKVYRRSGNYDLAKEKFNETINYKDLIKNYPEVYVLALGNYARTLFESQDFENLPDLYLRALHICDSINSEYNSIIIHQHLAEFYDFKNNKDSALYHAYKAKDISEKYNNDDLLKSLWILSEIEDSDKAAAYLKSYIKLNDSLQKAERAIRDKFARIRFDTQRVEQENRQIAKERMWLLIISIIVIIASLLLYLVIRQRNKNKELQFIQEQQQANEEIYNLMLSQNESIEEARALEKQRISKELHDGVLGRLFGTRLSLDSLNMNQSAEAVKTRGQYIQELKTIEEDIRKVSHELNTDFVSGAGFIDILKTLVDTQCIAYGLHYALDYDEVINWDAVSNKKKIHIYRLVQEALHNIYKHAKAENIKISFKLKNSVICLKIKDDGSGFDVNKAKSGIGLKNMNSRISEIQGLLEINSEIDKGTTVRIEVPID
ncbi:tetratricopeptide repeat-containing sensor histidine kinase [Aestuariivivens sediminicola]|uniref:tetratricopeptide repeat-containing sensor histidine kinase n=1 Tax=Aestuariivivens sediminicola TaxID=2913560 RepID=UPI001F55B6C3|nr:sensor histidine kinase [Aestuariivivens sediminicola]